MVKNSSLIFSAIPFAGLMMTVTMVQVAMRNVDVIKPSIISNPNTGINVGIVHFHEPWIHNICTVLSNVCMFLFLSMCG